MDRVETLIHVGIGKSGTTGLQEMVFNRHPGLLNVGRPNHRTQEYRKFHARLTQGYVLDGEDNGAAFLKAKREEARSSAKTLVLSDEALTAQGKLMAVVAQRLRTIAPEAHILITIRNQYDAIQSYYANHGRILKSAPKPYFGRYVAFEDWWTHANEHRQSSYLGRIAYWDMARLFINEFGRDRVHALVFEERVRAPEIFAEKLAPLLGIPCGECTELLLSAKAKNPRDSARAVSFTSLRERFAPGLRLPRRFPGRTAIANAVDRALARGAAYDEPLSQDVKAEIEAMYAHGNAQLARDFSLDLGAYGYPLAAVA